MNELCRLRRSERYEVRADEKPDKACASTPHPQTHKRPQCGRFSGFGSVCQNGASASPFASQAPFFGLFRPFLYVNTREFGGQTTI